MSERDDADHPETVCPRCAVGCSLEYDADAERAVGVEGAPVNPDGRLCPKGINAYDGVEEGRLTRPLVRVDGDLEPASWADAYDRIESGVATIRERYGGEALAFLGAPRCTNEENYLFQKLARVLGTNTVDNRARSCHSTTVSAMTDRLGSPGMTNSLRDLAEADAFLVVGANPAAQQPIAFNSYVRPAVNDGATLIHVDPRANRTTRTADVHLAPRPGTDALLVSLLAATVLDEGLVDESFVAERTSGFESYADRLRDVDVPAMAARTGVDLERIRDAARAFGRADRAAVVTGTGVEGDDREAVGPDALLNLLLLTGNLGRRGTGMNPLRGLVNEQGANDTGARPTTLPGYRDVTNPDERAAVADVWGVEPPGTPGLAELDAIRAFGDEVRGAWVLGENPAVSKMADHRVARRLESLDLLVVQDVSWSETTAHADVVLPASVWAEKAGTVTNLDRQVQSLAPSRSPPGDARVDRRVLQEVGARVSDVPSSFEYDDPGRVFEEMTDVNPLYAGMTYAGVEDGGQRWPFPADAERGRQVLHADAFESGDRRAEFDPTVLDAFDHPADADDGALGLLTRNRINEGDADRSVGDGGQERACWLNPADARTRDVADGETVVVAQDGTSTRAVVQVTDDVRRGTVFLDAIPASLDADADVRVRAAGS